MKELTMIERLKKLTRHYAALSKLAMIQMQNGNITQYVHTLVEVERVRHELALRYKVQR
jgi:hypothetical protein